MGCNLCTLQKREEHYKLLYEIAQVSGSDSDIAAVLDALLPPRLLLRLREEADCVSAR
ncbi:unnamed protein product [Tetraodon nigroviridis]|uniref:(spotted green pufferfish) hypothetical protein n=1 Tax=Tetraodon nigroviridis TaxID=99883 RepID=Q4RSH0_TETNG|nr:unnamed protein product [Tetraodon nigroviridis]